MVICFYCKEEYNSSSLIREKACFFHPSNFFSKKKCCDNPKSSGCVRMIHTNSEEERKDVFLRPYAVFTSYEDFEKNIQNESILVTEEYSGLTIEMLFAKEQKMTIDVDLEQSEIKRKFREKNYRLIRFVEKKEDTTNLSAPYARETCIASQKFIDFFVYPLVDK